MRGWVVAVALVGLLARDAKAQGMPADSMTHMPAFTEGIPAGWSIAPPHIDLNAGLFLRSRETGSAMREGFVRLHVQLALGTRHLASATDLTFLPGVGATPTFSTVVQLQPLRPAAPIFLAGGLGVITGHGGGRDRMTALAQGVAAFRLPAHEIALFVQASKALRAGERAELLFGIAHPLAPYRHKFF